MSPCDLYGFLDDALRFLHVLASRRRAESSYLRRSAAISGPLHAAKRPANRQGTSRFSYRLVQVSVYAQGRYTLRAGTGFNILQQAGAAAAAPDVRFCQVAAPAVVAAAGPFIRRPKPLRPDALPAFLRCQPGCQPETVVGLFPKPERAGAGEDGRTAPAAHPTGVACIVVEAPTFRYHPPRAPVERRS